MQESNNFEHANKAQERKVMTSQEVKEIMQRSRQAQKIWASLSLQERLQFIASIRKYLMEEGEMMSRVIAKATGKPVFEAYTSELLACIDILSYYEKKASKILADQKVSSSLYMPLKKNFIQYRPLGVILILSPWNYPLNLSLIPMISALIAGNSVILKISPETPQVADLLEEMLLCLNFPKDLVQIVYTNRDSGIGSKLIEQRPDKIFFTGSTAVGMEILKQASQWMIPVELELGGKDPMIVFKDANLERAVSAAVWGAFTNSGQVCTSVERVYVQAEVYEKFLSMVRAKIGEIWQGNEPYADMGCMSTDKQIALVREQLEEAKSQGAVVYAKGVMLENSRFIPPMLLTQVNHQMRIMKEETFGPVMPVMQFRTEEEAVYLANDSIYGLSASIFTRDEERAKRVSAKIQAGNIHINDVIISVANPRLPFGGVKSSGMGRYHGSEGLRTFTQTVSLVVDHGIRDKEIHWFPYSKNKMSLVKKMVKLFKK